MIRAAVIGLGLLSLAAPHIAAAQPRETAARIFQCVLQNGKTVQVTARGARLDYRYGTARGAELMLSGTARSGNVKYLTQRYASIQHQLRFSRGEYSYIVHSMGASTERSEHARAPADLHDNERAGARIADRHRAQPDLYAAGRLYRAGQLHLHRQ